MPKRVSNYKVPIVFVHQPGDAYQPQGVDMKRRFVLAPQRGAAYQPRVQPWVRGYQLFLPRPNGAPHTTPGGNPGVKIPA